MEKKAFTLMELMIVIVIIGMIAAFAIPSFNKAMAKSRERDAITQLTAIHSANKIYYTRNGSYVSGSNLTASQISGALNITVISGGLTFDYDRTSPSTYTCSAAWNENGTANDFTLRFNEQPLSTTNPCCLAGACPTINNSCT